ncbi:MAG: RNA-binding protein [Candidatus Neomarinimicrobiota bacterium]|nr:KH domain-containing protein [Candidatus Neomarinimicrobiota bacterium]MCD6101111.1 KH domain-containing protein [Candidatus Neomarinimicrobiota bacterium]RKY47285.1 MAG: RNA-binding protein [Candidatus Neomarinimicrobiota bacterium]RKY47685.1 MAG: RNA-binding protein [Candidatus Neomarinimicrobiota bacterium]RKY53425.1 MAG: RNA-binding protein [Candidatus Neomarinimicrobiota bacterium]
MKEFVEYIVKKLVDRPDQVKVSQIDSERTVILELSVDPADLGKVIGKNGRTAKALRTIITAVAAKQGQKRAILEILE